MHTQMKQTRIFPRRLSTGLCWFIAVEYFLLAPFKFSPVGLLGYPSSYFVKFVNWGYPAWFSPVIGASELVAAVLLTLPRRRFLGAVMLVALMTGATTTHIVNHDTLADSIAAPIELVLAGIAALTHWPADWREPLAFGPLKASSDSATHSSSSIGHIPSSSSVKGVIREIPPISSGDQLEVEDRVGNLVNQDRNRGQ
jgi:DoxX-like family